MERLTPMRRNGHGFLTLAVYLLLALVAISISLAG
jgi:hypothetical protein